MASRFECVTAALFGGTDGNLSQSDQQPVDGLIETIADAVDTVRARAFRPGPYAGPAAYSGRSNSCARSAALEASRTRPHCA